MPAVRRLVLARAALRRAARPRHDHRSVRSGIVWGIRRRTSWRAVPQACGKGALVDQRDRLWRPEGRWPRSAALRIAEREMALEGAFLGRSPRCLAAAAAP